MISQDKNTQLYETIYNNSVTGIIIVNEKGEIVSANAYLLELFGHKMVDLIGQKIEILIPSRYHHSHVKSRDSYIQRPATRPMGMGMDLVGIKNDGTEFPVEVSLTHCEINQNMHTIGFINDISIRKKTEQEIINLNEELEKKVEDRTIDLQNAIDELEKSKAELSVLLKKEKEVGELKSRFVTMASHEFRTPLSTILSSTYLIDNYKLTEEDEKRKKHLDRIISSVNILTDTLNDFLNVGKIEEGKIQVRITAFNIEEVINDVIQSMNNNLKSGQSIQYTHKGLLIANLDVSLFKHILQNLISNAIKFSPLNSKIEIYSEINESQIHLAVKDYGLGISKEDQAHLSERFFRSENVTNIEGTGLGLHLVKKYAELINGSCECESELEKGTTMMVNFKL